MKVLVTGYKGFIGQNMTKAVFNKGWELTTFDIVDNPNTRPKDLNIEDCDWVIHLGAISSTTETNIQKLMDQNLSWSIELLEECNKHRVNMQFASSASVYGKRQIRNGPFKETDDCKPANYYAMSKYLFEQYVNTKSDLNISVQLLRYFNVYGPHEDHKGSQASPYYQFAKQAKETGTIKVFEGSENYLRDFIHIDRLIELQLELLHEEYGGIYNIGTGNPRSFLDIARDVALLYDAKIETIPFPEHLRKHYQTYTCAG